MPHYLPRCCHESNVVLVLENNPRPKSVATELTHISCLHLRLLVLSANDSQWRKGLQHTDTHTRTQLRRNMNECITLSTPFPTGKKRGIRPQQNEG
jgi:hypothetical protein